MNPIISICNLSKKYANGFQALHNVNLSIHKGEILALLGPNGAGKTTMISIICGIVTPGTGTVTVGDHDIIRDYRVTRGMIGLVPQELTLGMFDTVWNTVRFSRGLFGKSHNRPYLEQLLKDLSLWEKRDSEIMSLSGGMKRRVLIAKALAHEPSILFLDEPTAGVDVSLRKSMWKIVERLRQSGVTIILTTHYIEEAEAIADRVGVINKGELIIVDDKQSLKHKLGQRQLTIELDNTIEDLPETLDHWRLEISADGKSITYSYDMYSQQTGVAALLREVDSAGLPIKDIHTSQSSLEDIFVNLVKDES